MNNTNFTNYDRWKTTPPDEKETLVGRDWEGIPIYKEHGEDYADIDGDLVLFYPHELYDYVRRNFDVYRADEMEGI